MTNHEEGEPMEATRSEVEDRIIDDDRRRSGEFLRDFIKRHCVSGAADSSGGDDSGPTQ